MENVKLYIFDLNGTLTNTPFVDHTDLAILPGRKEKIAQLIAGGAYCAIATNQGGVAFGFATEDEAKAEVAGIAKELGITHWQISFGHPKPKWGYEQYGTRAALAMRKPEPGMLLALMEELKVEAYETLMIGDRDEDRDAASKAECQFLWAKDFFAEPGELMARIYQLYLQVAELVDATDLPLYIESTDGQGHIGRSWADFFAGWDSLEEAPARIQEGIEKYKKLMEDRAKQPAYVGDDFDPFLDSDDLP